VTIRLVLETIRPRTLFSSSSPCGRSPFHLGRLYPKDSIPLYRGPPQVVKLMETWFHQPNPEMERRATQSKIAGET